MKTPESIIRGIMHESVMSEVKRHVGSTNPTKVAKHFKDLANSLKEQIQLNEAQNHLYGINQTSPRATAEIKQLVATLPGYTITAAGGSNNTHKVYYGDRLITQIQSGGGRSGTGPGGHRRSLVDIHNHQLEIGGFSGTEHTVKTIKRSLRGLDEEVEQLDEKSAAWQRSEGKDPEGGLNRKGVASYRREHPGSKLSMAVTTKPSKLKPGSKAANRRKSFCARMGGMKKRLTSAKTAHDPDARINKALRKWNC